MYSEIGDAFASAGLAKEAVGEYRRALDLGPQFVDVRLKLGNALRDLGDLEGAIAQFEEMSRINPNFLPGQVSYGIALLSAGRREEAIKIWEAVIARDPQNRSAGMYLNLVRQQPSKVDPKVDRAV
jgi:tetratricopeptide (TPR) repeat protein